MARSTVKPPIGDLKRSRIRSFFEQDAESESSSQLIARLATITGTDREPVSTSGKFAEGSTFRHVALESPVWRL
jgi:hypothetical protein